MIKTKNIFIFIFILFITAMIFADNNTPDNEIKKLKSNLSELEKKYQELEKKYQADIETINRNLNTEISISSNSITSISNILTTFSILFAALGLIIGSVIGVYITIIYNRSNKVYLDNKEILNSYEKIQKEINIAREDIHDNLSNIYNGLKKEEFKEILKRLNEVPEDIAHYHSKLLSTILPYDYYNELKNIFIKFKARVGNNSSSYYILVLFQHYPERFFFDNELYPLVENNLNGLIIKNMFESDIINSFEKILKYYYDRKINFDEKLHKFLEGFQISKFKNNDRVYSKIIDCLKDNKLNEFIKFIESFPDLKIFLDKTKQFI